MLLDAVIYMVHQQANGCIATPLFLWAYAATVLFRNNRGSMLMLILSGT
jgi:hypothetical protein